MSTATLWLVEHRTTRAHLRSRLAARRVLRSTDVARFDFLGTDLGSARSDGLAPGWTSLRRELGFAVWPEGHDDRLAPLRAGWRRQALAWWELRLRIARVRGSWHGDRLGDLKLDRDRDPGAPLAVLTLGRTPPRRFADFTFDALPKIARDAAAAPGLILAAAAGSPLTGSVTFTVWRDGAAMRSFAYGRGGAHAETIKRDARLGLLTEQLVLSMRPEGLDGSWQRSRNRAALSALGQLIQPTG